MELVCDFGGAGAFCDKGLNFFQLVLITVLKPRGVMKNELWVAGEAERATNIMDPALIESSVIKRTSTSKWDYPTPAEGTSLFTDGLSANDFSPG
jgi:hypothetical protein